MTTSLKAKLAIGPMSSDVIEAAFQYSQTSSKELMLISSKNQIDWDGGYVNNWKTKQYGQFLERMRSKYPGSQILVCRDHCGPGFKHKALNDIYRTIDSDTEAGFDLIHVDVCRFPGSDKDRIDKAQEIIAYIKRHSPEMLIEVGTDENEGHFLENSKVIENEINIFTSNSPIEFYVCQTGSLIKEISQVGGFNKPFVSIICRIAEKYGVRLKEHNADYLNTSRIEMRRGLIDALNIAPQLGVLQTQLTITKCLAYGIDFSDFLNQAYESGNWKKWMYKNRPSNKLLCCVIAGHYVFSGKEYQKIYEEINKHEDFKKTIISEMIRVFDLYIKSLQ